MEDAFLIGAGFAVGLVLGSFATVLSYRLPRGLSIVAPGSRCVACGQGLTPRDLVPVLSWLVQRGRCRYCGVYISARYPIIELATAVLCAIAFYGFGLSLLLVPLLCGIVACVACAAVLGRYWIKTD